MYQWYRIGGDWRSDQPLEVAVRGKQVLITAVIALAVTVAYDTQKSKRG